MSTIERTFTLTDRLPLPADTVIVEPTLPPRAAHSLFPVLNPSHGGCGCTYLTPPDDMYSDVYGKVFLAVSPSKASYIVLNKSFLRSFRELMGGATIEESAVHMGDSKAERDVALRELLTQMVLRNFFEDAQTVTFLPDGQVLHFYLTNRCNLRCVHCYMSSGDALPQGELTTLEKLQVLDMFAAIYPNGQVTFSGGEAMMSGDFFTVLEHAASLGLRIQLYTNGLLICPANVDRLIELVTLLQISLDGATAPVNDALRG